MGVRLKRVVNGDSGNRVFKAAGGVQILQPRPLGFAGLPSGGSAGTIQTASKCCRSRPSPVVSRGRQVRLDQDSGMAWKCRATGAESQYLTFSHSALRIHNLGEPILTGDLGLVGQFCRLTRDKAPSITKGGHPVGRKVP